MTRIPSAPSLGHRSAHLGILLLGLVGASAFPTPARAESSSSESPEYPHVRLTIDPTAGRHMWVLRIQNIDSVPLRLVADTRLLSIDVTPPGPHATTVHCTLPAEMRPSSDEDRVVLVPPELSYVDGFDPRLYCFGAKEDRAILPGATIVGRFGFPGQRAKKGPPYVVASTGSERSPNQEIVGEPRVLPEPAAPSPPTPIAKPSVEDETPISPASISLGVPPRDRLAVSTPTRIDATSLRDLSLYVTVTNTTAHTVRLLLRPETVAIEAAGPEGKMFCQASIKPTPIVDLFTTLLPRARAGTDVLVSSLCPPSFFSRPGLYTLRASIETSEISGDRIGIRTFHGDAIASTPTLVRLRTAKGTEPLR